MGLLKKIATALGICEKWADGYSSVYDSGTGQYVTYVGKDAEKMFQPTKERRNFEEWY